MAFIDIHGHYAWDIDDGMPSLEDAKNALTQANGQFDKDEDQYYDT